MNKVVANLRTNETLIRIGHFSHVECITLDKVRDPKTRMGRGRRPLPWGTTRTLANGIYPFGWAKLEFLDLAGRPRPTKDWPFLLESRGEGAKRFVPEDPEFKASDDQVHPSVAVEEGRIEKKVPTKKVEPVEPETISPLERLIKELDLVKANDMGRIGTVIQKIDTLETDAEKGEIAKAIRDKIGAKAFKKHKRKKHLLELIKKAK